MGLTVPRVRLYPGGMSRLTWLASCPSEMRWQASCAINGFNDLFRPRDAQHGFVGRQTYPSRLSIVSVRLLMSTAKQASTSLKSPESIVPHHDPFLQLLHWLHI